EIPGRQSGEFGNAVPGETSLITDPLRLPVPRLQQSHRPLRRRAPRTHPFSRPYLYLPITGYSALQRSPGVRYQPALITPDLSRIPKIAFTRSQLLRRTGNDDLE